MRLFKRRVSDPAPQLVSLAPINSEMDHPNSGRMISRSSSYRNSEDYADYQTVTAVPAFVVDDAPRKGQSLNLFFFFFFSSSLLFFEGLLFFFIIKKVKEGRTVSSLALVVVVT